MNGLKRMRIERIDSARRVASKYSMDAMAKALGVTRPTYAAMERDPGRITADQARKIADYLGCDAEDIFLASEES